MRGSRRASEHTPFPQRERQGWQPNALSSTFSRSGSKRSVLINTERLRLRNLTVSDLDDELCEWFLDPVLQSGLNIRADEWTKDRLTSRLQALPDTPNYFFGIFARPAGQPVGFIAFDTNPWQRTAEMTVAIGNKDWRSKGVLAEIGKPLVADFMQNGKIDRVVIHVLASNRRVLFELIGSNFFYEARLREAALLASGEREDLLVFAILKSVTFPHLRG
jgi:RimJ/RimL family protein N-acetyltransferase